MCRLLHRYVLESAAKEAAEARLREEEELRKWGEERLDKERAEKKKLQKRLVRCRLSSSHSSIALRLVRCSQRHMPLHVRLLSGCFHFISSNSVSASCCRSTCSTCISLSPSLYLP